jgi:type I restriction enzyme S subunit
MSKWPTRKIGELLTRVKDDIRIDDLATYSRITIHMTGKGISLRDRVTGTEIGTKRQFIARAGQFVLSKIDARNGAFGVLPDECDNAIVTGNFWVFDVDHTQLDRQFFNYLSKSPGFVAACVAASDGTTNRRYLQENTFLEMAIPVPKLIEQQTLVTRLDALAKKTRQVEAHLDAVERISSALLLSLHHQLAGDRIIRLGDVMDLSESTESVTAAGNYPQVGVRGFGGGLFSKAAINGTETSYKSFNRLYEGAIVLSQVKGWEGAIARCPAELDGWFVSPEYRTFKCKPTLSSDEYIGELVQTEWFWSRLQNATRGVGARRERTRPEQFLNIAMPMPELDDQLRIVEILKRQVPLKTKHTAIRQANAALLPATLERVFAKGA